MSRQWKVLIVVSAAIFVANLDLFVVNIAFPAIARDFNGTGIAGLSWVLNAYAIVFAALLVPAGRLADRAGRKRGFLGGVLVFTFASALCAAAPSAATLVAARMLQAVGAAFLLPTSLALLLPEFSPEKRPVAIGVWAAVGGVAAAAGPPIGGVLVEANWRLVFLINLPVGIAALITGARLLEEHRDRDQRRPDLLGTVVLGAAIALLSLALVKGPDWGFGSGRALGAFVASALLLIAFVARSARHPAPVVELSLLRVRSFAAANGAALLFTAAFAAMLLEASLFLTGVWHESVLIAGLSIAPGPLMAASFAVPSGRLSARFGQRAVALPGLALFALGCAWWASRVGVRPDYAGALLPGLIVTGIGVGLTLSPLASAATGSLPPLRFATGSAVFTMSRQLGAVFGVAILIAVLGHPATGEEAVAAFRDGWWFMVAATALAALAAAAIGQARPQAHVALAAAEAA
jgi:EmrB/QacA subfamily drug resistance transporter